MTKKLNLKCDSSDKLKKKVDSESHIHIFFSSLNIFKIVFGTLSILI